MEIIDQREVLGKEFSIYGDFENPLFLAKDVAVMIEYDVSSINKLLNSVDEDEKVRKSVPTLGGSQEMWLLTEEGLYEVLMQSRKSIAKTFKKEIKKILKSIRKHGAYLTPSTLEKAMKNPRFLIGVLEVLEKEQQKNETLSKENTTLLQEKEAAQPKITLADAITTSSDNILIRDLAKILFSNGIKIGQNRLFKWLRDNGYLVSRKGSSYNTPSQKSMELGLFKINEAIILHLSGETTIAITSRVTGNGQQYFINKLIGKCNMTGIINTENVAL